MPPRYFLWMLVVLLALSSLFVVFLATVSAEEEAIVTSQVFVIHSAPSEINAASAGSQVCEVTAELRWYRTKKVKVLYQWPQCSAAGVIRWELASVRAGQGKLTLHAGGGEDEVYNQVWPELKLGDAILLRTWINDARQADIVTEYQDTSPVWPRIHTRPNSAGDCFQFTGHNDPWGVFSAEGVSYKFFLPTKDWETVWLRGPDQPTVDWHVQFYRDAALTQLRSEYWFNGVANPCYGPTATPTVPSTITITPPTPIVTVTVIPTVTVTPTPTWTSTIAPTITVTPPTPIVTVTVIPTVTITPTPTWTSTITPNVTVKPPLTVTSTVTPIVDPPMIPTLTPIPTLSTELVCELQASHFGDPIGRSRINAWIKNAQQTVVPLVKIKINWNNRGTVSYPTAQQTGAWFTNTPFELISQPEVPDVGFGYYKFEAWAYAENITNPAYCWGEGYAPDHDNLAPDPGPFAQDNPEGKFNRGEMPSRLPQVPRLPFDGGNGPDQIELFLWAFEKEGRGVQARITGIANQGQPLARLGMESIRDFVKFDGLPAREGIVYGFQIGEHGPWGPLFCPEPDANPTTITVHWGAGGQTWLSDPAAYGDCWWLTVAAALQGWVTVDETVATYNALQGVIDWHGHVNLVFALAQNRETGLGPRMQDVALGLQGRDRQGAVIPTVLPPDFWQVIEAYENAKTSQPHE